MNLAYGFVAQTLQTHDELVATRINEQHRNAAAQRAERGERGERASRRPSLAHRLGERLHGRDARDIRGARTAH